MIVFRMLASSSLLTRSESYDIVLKTSSHHLRHRNYMESQEGGRNQEGSLLIEPSCLYIALHSPSSLVVHTFSSCAL